MCHTCAAQAQLAPSSWTHQSLYCFAAPTHASLFLLSVEPSSHPFWINFFSTTRHQFAFINDDYVYLQSELGHPLCYLPYSFPSWLSSQFAIILVCVCVCVCSVCSCLHPSLPLDDRSCAALFHSRAFIVHDGAWQEAPARWAAKLTVLSPDSVLDMLLSFTSSLNTQTLLGSYFY